MFKIDWRMYFHGARLEVDSAGMWLYIRRIGTYHAVPVFHDDEQFTLGM